MYRVRLAGPDDAGVVRELLGERLPGVDLERRIAWAYRGTPYGDALVWIAVEDGTDEPAGLTTFFRRKMWIDGRELGGALGGDMYVRPSHRRRGIGKQLFIAARREMHQHDVHIMFGTPMPANVTPLRSSGSTVPEHAVVRCVRLLSTRAPWFSWLPRAVGKMIDPLLAPRRLAAFRLDPVRATDERVDELWRETRDELAIAVVRDAAFYRWRFAESPSQRQKAYVLLKRDRPFAACALEETADRLLVVDLVAPRARWREALLAIAASTDRGALEMRLATADARRRRAWSAGLIERESSPMSMLTAAGSPLEARVHDARNWFLTWADTDIDYV